MAGLAAERLLPGEGYDIELRPIELLRKSRRCGVANGESAAVGGDPVGIGHAHPGGGAVPGENDVVPRIDAGKIRKLAITRAPDGRVL